MQKKDLIHIDKFENEMVVENQVQTKYFISWAIQKRKKVKFSANQMGILSTCPVKRKTGEALNKL